MILVWNYNESLHPFPNMPYVYSSDKLHKTRTSIIYKRKIIDLYKVNIYPKINRHIN